MTYYNDSYGKTFTLWVVKQSQVSLELVEKSYRLRQGRGLVGIEEKHMDEME